MSQANTQTLSPKAPQIELVLIETPEGDAAFYLNGEIIITAEAGTDDIVDDVRTVANNTSTALVTPIRKVDFQFSEGNNKTWNQMYDALKNNQAHTIIDHFVDDVFA